MRSWNHEDPRCPERVSVLLIADDTLPTWDAGRAAWQARVRHFDAAPWQQRKLAATHTMRRPLQVAGLPDFTGTWALPHHCPAPGR